MRLCILLAAMALAAGCMPEGGPQGLRENNRRAYHVEVEGEARDVHRTLTEAFYRYGWGESFAVHHEFWTERQAGSMWATARDPRHCRGFLVDVQESGPGRSRVSVYPVDGFFARKSREWLRDLRFTIYDL
jgi:hypothetical protein